MSLATVLVRTRGIVALVGLVLAACPAPTPPECETGATRPCYGGPAGTEGVGLCRGGTESCVDEAWSGTKTLSPGSWVEINTYDVFLNDPPTPRLLFWARRQAMELCIHRVDAESAVARCTPFPPKVAADGIDEFLTGFITRGKGAVHRDTPHTIGVVPTDVDERWTVTIRDGPIVTERKQSKSDCTVTGPASDIFMALWNRPASDAMQVAGDASLITDLGANVRIRWS